MRNAFLEELLTLQQDGSGAIVKPDKFLKDPPLLEVETELDKVVDKICTNALCNGGANKTGYWHFFVGSPGNGKSAAVGKLCRKLRDKSCRFLVDKVDLEDLEEGIIPYRIEVYEGNNKFSSLWLAQDASVVKDPFSEEVDPAKELNELLADAWYRGVSIVVCTNRGVIEKAYRAAHEDQKVTNMPWVHALRHAVYDEGKFGGQAFSEKFKKKVFKIFDFEYTQLDDHSLLINNDTFERVIKKATGSEHWEICKECPAFNYCPFLLNREWLSNPTALSNFIDTLSKIELFSGQIIVFREALALLSFILAGCPKDYHGINPCEWVIEHEKKGDYFSLLSRRIYMSLFSSHTPYGLEANDTLKKRQVASLIKIVETNDDKEASILALRRIVKPERHISSDVGLGRLLGPEGTMKRLDPINEALPETFTGKWDGDLDNVKNDTSPLVSPLEKKCCELWSCIENKIESSTEDAIQRYKWLRRWISSFTFRLGGMVDNRLAFTKELSELLQVFYLKGKALTPGDLQQLKILNDNLQMLLVSEKGEGIKVSSYVSLCGEWARNTLKPQIFLGSKAKTLGLPIRFAAKQETVLSAETFAWLKKRCDCNLTAICFPLELLEAAQDAQAAAASTSQYAYQDNEIELKIQKDDGTIINLTRFQGAVIVE